MKTIIVTGGAGFIGGNFVPGLVQSGSYRIVTIDALTYAGNLDTLKPIMDHPNHRFVRGDIRDGALLTKLFAEEKPVGIINFAAESHVDRSIDAPDDFIQTNIVGAHELLKVSLAYWRDLDPARQENYRHLQISTDEVYGSLGQTGAFSETTPYAPNSPYSASKASADHLTRSYHETFGLPTLITNCSNNYGPYQFPEKLIPLVINRALGGLSLPVYGDGMQIRDWLYVEDHCSAIRRVFEHGVPGEVYNIGGKSERANIEVVKTLCALLDALRPGSRRYEEQIEFVTDRPGHDRRYAIDCSKIGADLGWSPRESFETGLRKTVQWYLDNETWVGRVMTGAYRGERLGLEEEA